ncbi:hypothetical protein DFH07DRAFT_842145 [Mycena maculata]|uniref:Uncharacterized protein n=1 Tax=Mycena maculata TaxID=230809 RepID=A0AAD7MYC4_9AGAR|nr:hypothetical protein DFH07DRAFT_842145 [Mycena maculata]
MSSTPTTRTKKTTFTVPFKRLASFSRNARKSKSSPTVAESIPVSLPKSSTKSGSFETHPSIDSTASCSSWASSESTTYSPSLTPPERKRKVRHYPSACVDIIVRGVSTILFIPIPFLEKHDECISNDSSAVSEQRRSGALRLRRVVSRDPRPLLETEGDEAIKPGRTRKRNSLVLPEVPIPDAPHEPNLPVGLAAPAESRTRESPPPIECRTVRFIIPPPKFAPPPGRDDEEPAWSDFMVRYSFISLPAFLVLSFAVISINEEGKTRH